MRFESRRSRHRPLERADFVCEKLLRSLTFELVCSRGKRRVCGSLLSEVARGKDSLADGVVAVFSFRLGLHAQAIRHISDSTCFFFVSFRFGFRRFEFDGPILYAYASVCR